MTLRARTSLVTLLTVAVAAGCHLVVGLETTRSSDGNADGNVEDARVDAGPAPSEVLYAAVYAGAFPVACVARRVPKPWVTPSLYVGGSLDDHDAGLYEWRFDDIEVRLPAPSNGASPANAPTAGNPGCVSNDQSAVAAWPYRLWCNDFDGVSTDSRLGFDGLLGFDLGDPNVQFDTVYASSPPSSLLFRFPPSNKEVSRGLLRSWPGVDSSRLRLEFRFRFGTPDSGAAPTLDINLGLLALGLANNQVGVVFGAIGGEMAVAFSPSVAKLDPHALENLAVKLGKRYDPTGSFLPVAIEITPTPPVGLDCPLRCLPSDPCCNGGSDGCNGADGG